MDYISGYQTVDHDPPVGYKLIFVACERANNMEERHGTLASADCTQGLSGHYQEAAANEVLK